MKRKNKEFRRLEQNTGILFAKYVSQSVLGMVGISAYILADTFFISVAAGTEGIAALNLALPVYAVIFAIGSMIGVGAATRYTIRKASGDPKAFAYFGNSIFWVIAIGLIFTLSGLLGAEKILKVMGAGEGLIRIGGPYLRIAMGFSPFFMLNYAANAFTRNDGAPTIAMAATLGSSLFNILFDYIFMFPMHMGMNGAALATAISPIVGTMICMIHLLSKKSGVTIRGCRISWKLLLESCQLGTAAFIGEFASGITTLVFNALILSRAGEDGVAAYGVIANVSLVVIAVFNGITTGSQPLISYFFGSSDKKNQKRILLYSIVLSLVFSAFLYTGIWICADSIVGIFNSEGNRIMEQLAVKGMRIYFSGMFFAGLNIVFAGYFGAISEALSSTVISFARGIILILLFAIVLAVLLGMNGIWAAFPVTEGVTLLLTGGIFCRYLR